MGKDSEREKARVARQAAVKAELRGGLSKPIPANHAFSDAESWINGFDSRFDDVLKKFENIEEY